MLRSTAYFTRVWHHVVYLCFACIPFDRSCPSPNLFLPFHISHYNWRRKKKNPEIFQTRGEGNNHQQQINFTLLIRNLKIDWFPSTTWMKCRQRFHYNKESLFPLRFHCNLSMKWSMKCQGLLFFFVGKEGSLLMFVCFFGKTTSNHCSRVFLLN